MEKDLSLNLNDLEQVAGGNAPYDSFEYLPEGFEVERRVLLNGQPPLPCPHCKTNYMYVIMGRYNNEPVWHCAWCNEINPLDPALLLD